MAALQGVLSPFDALRAVEVGVDGIIVSNHGGRQLDFAPATLDCVANIKRAIGDSIPILMDGGVRRGTDILKVGVCFQVRAGWGSGCPDVRIEQGRSQMFCLWSMCQADHMKHQ